MNLDLRKYSGLQLPIYISSTVLSNRHMSQEQIVLKFPEDGELVGLWVSFLRGNH